MKRASAVPAYERVVVAGSGIEARARVEQERVEGKVVEPLVEEDGLADVLEIRGLRRVVENVEHVDEVGVAVRLGVRRLEVGVGVGGAARAS